MRSLFVFLLMTASSLHASSPLPKISTIDGLFVPKGYDDNDIVEVVISGHFPDSCHQVAEPKVEIDHESKEISLTPLNHESESDVCIKMISSYTQVVHLGKLESSTYSFKVAGNPQIIKAITVKQAQKAERDDFLYPPVDYADLTTDSHGNTLFMIKGRYPKMKRGCMQLVGTHMEMQDGEVLVVQPKASVVFLNRGCDAGYEKTYRLDRSVSGNVLLHVRSIHGQAYNRILDIEHP